jgi:hypothetical protein
MSVTNEGCVEKNIDWPCIGMCIPDILFYGCRGYVILF